MERTIRAIELAPNSTPGNYYYRTGIDLHDDQIKQLNLEAARTGVRRISPPSQCFGSFFDRMVEVGGKFYLVQTIETNTALVAQCAHDINKGKGLVYQEPGKFPVYVRFSETGRPESTTRMPREMVMAYFEELMANILPPASPESPEDQPEALPAGSLDSGGRMNCLPVPVG